MSTPTPPVNKTRRQKTDEHKLSEITKAMGWRQLNSYVAAAKRLGKTTLDQRIMLAKEARKLTEPVVWRCIGCDTLITHQWKRVQSVTCKNCQKKYDLDLAGRYPCHVMHEDTPVARLNKRGRYYE